MAGGTSENCSSVASAMRSAAFPDPRTSSAGVPIVWGLLLGVIVGVWGLGFEVWGVGCGDWGLEFCVWSLGIGIWGLGFWGLGSGIWAEVWGSRV